MAFRELVLAGAARGSREVSQPLEAELHSSIFDLNIGYANLMTAIQRGQNGDVVDLRRLSAVLGFERDSKTLGREVHDLRSLIAARQPQHDRLGVTARRTSKVFSAIVLHGRALLSHGIPQLASLKSLSRRRSEVAKMQHVFGKAPRPIKTAIPTTPNCATVGRAVKTSFWCHAHPRTLWPFLVRKKVKGRRVALPARKTSSGRESSGSSPPECWRRPAEPHC